MSTDDVRRGEFHDALRAGDERLRDHIDQSYARLALADDAADRRIDLALISADKLEQERIRAVEQRLDAAIAERERAAEVLREDLARTAQSVSEEREKTAAALRADTGQQMAALKEQVLSLVEARTKQFDLVHEASQRAVQTAAEENRAWRAAANEWRGQSADRERSQERQMLALSSSFLPREVADQQFGQITDRLRGLESDRSSREGATTAEVQRQEKTQPWMIWAAGCILTVVITLVVLVVNLLTAAPA